MLLSLGLVVSIQMASLQCCGVGLESSYGMPPVDTFAPSYVAMAVNGAGEVAAHDTEQVKSLKYTKLAVPTSYSMWPLRPQVDVVPKLLPHHGLTDCSLY